VLRAQLKNGDPAFEGRFYSARVALEPRPNRPDGPPIWIGSWGSDAGLRRVARLGDGWLASAYNTTPAQAVQAREKLSIALAESGRNLDRFACSLATMWTYVTDDDWARRAHLLVLERLLNRPAELLNGRVFVGPADDCAATLQAYADAGFDRVFIWPIADVNKQLERFMREVVPLVQRPAG
jgi:alkanesulfonate monooxygenase SsuD/methylene tetrahydromethanopterin reductase-like flavin-dependent oxidoreductase (luciferase family)